MFHVHHSKQMKAEMFSWWGGDRRHEALPIHSLPSHEESWGTCPQEPVEFCEMRWKSTNTDEACCGNCAFCPTPSCITEVCEYGLIH